MSHRRPVETQGWDSHAEVVDERWIERTPRTARVAERLAVECRLMPLLAPRLPLQVPVPTLVDRATSRVRHALVPGVPVTPARLDAADGGAVGRFLRALHDTPAEVWEGTGLGPDTDQVAALREMETQVVPLLPRALREPGRALLARCRQTVPQHRRLRHGDLGPEHLLTTGGRVTGVIDWTDVALGDPALDLAWLVHHTPAVFAEALVSAYRATPEELARGRDWDRLGPWWEVRHGLEGAGGAYVESGLEGVVERLRATP